MAFEITLEAAQILYPEYTFIERLTPSAQKAAFRVRSSNGDDLCFKIIAPEFAHDEYIRREVLALQTLDHPNIARLVEYTYSSHPGNVRHYIIEDFIEGIDLTAWLQNDVEKSLATTRALFVPIFEALSVIHNAGIVHRDLKPSNIRVRPDSSPVIIDFGLARHLNLVDITQTLDGAEIGTPPYFAPEQCRGNKYDIDNRTDLFAVGVLVYEATIGTHPFFTVGMSKNELYSSICDSDSCFDCPAFIGLPTDWQVLIRKLLSKERVNRPFNANLVLRLLTRIGV